MKAITDAPEPENVTELQSFLGLINYYRKFLPNMSTVCAPLNNLLCREVHWNLDSKCRSAFQYPKKLMTATVLAHYDPTKELVWAVDASPVGLGTVISHLDDDEKRPIAFASRSLTQKEIILKWRKKD